jgi:adenylylsulfate kinase
MLIAMAGLQASGKSTIARRLRPAISGVLLDKDEVRAALFPAPYVDYSNEQNDLCVDIIYQVSGYLLGRDPGLHVILDGRTYSKRYQIERLKAAAEQFGTPLRIVECVCSEQSVRQRLEQDDGHHPAADRDFALYQRIRAEAEPILEPKLVLDTDELSPDEAVRAILDYL